MANRPTSPMGAGNIFKLGGGGSEERFSTNFLPCNILGLMLNFAKVGGATAPLPPPSTSYVPGGPSQPICHIHDKHNHKHTCPSSFYPASPIPVRRTRTVESGEWRLASVDWAGPGVGGHRDGPCRWTCAACAVMASERKRLDACVRRGGSSDIGTDGKADKEYLKHFEYHQLESFFQASGNA